ncbi:MAG TPA: hypothetical protein VKM35_03005 [Arenimonas sp.]|nr:hypothetical protein [Arenimonas sp.]HMB56156.1 hypothetical protein [Arenimonas sp.]
MIEPHEKARLPAGFFFVSAAGNLKNQFARPGRWLLPRRDKQRQHGHATRQHDIGLLRSELLRRQQERTVEALHVLAPRGKLGRCEGHHVVRHGRDPGIVGVASVVFVECLAIGPAENTRRKHDPALARRQRDLFLDAAFAERARADGDDTLVVDQRAGENLSDALAFEFHPQAYAPSREYDSRRSEHGAWDFRKHFYGRVGDFDSKEEFECAVQLDMLAQQGRIKHWVRNLVNKPGCAFFLQKATGRFWSDFVCELPDGKILVVE